MKQIDLHLKYYFHPIFLFLVSLMLSFTPLAQAVTPPQNLLAMDQPNDEGTTIILQWDLSPQDDGSGTIITGYEIARSTSPAGSTEIIARTLPGVKSFKDRGAFIMGDGSTTEALNPETGYYYRVTAIDINGNRADTWSSKPAFAVAQWYHQGKTPILAATIIFFLLVTFFIWLARHKGGNLYVRPIAGMDEIDNAIGRATEMGRPILYVLGLGSPDDIATIASYTILARVARKTAEYRTDLIVPCNEPIVMTIAQETVKNAYMEAGHPDAYSDSMVYFLTSMQFAYVAGVNGLMLREKTATNCYFGKFYAESLLLSETGNIAGSIQVAGTDEVAQLPFFVTTCDYTLIGEELYAASAYLGRDPLLLGALKAQDFAKAIAMILILAGAILMTFEIDWIVKLVSVNL